MNTYALQVALHFQAESTDDRRFAVFLSELTALAAKHGISVDDHQSMQLRAADYTIAACAQCGHLTVNRTDIQPGVENILPDFWFSIRRGDLVAGILTCDLCKPIRNAT